ncbi:hypothetical protein DMA12_17620 [Amycolatopsis balhimycina DSM 5908]|uniref:Thioester reductase (TE) domain-containing protein n=1 Tax=Amycolatopsis balhimycina DSM 5908 TaxID=1081091 RepID=A0A428WLU6_AMYBA|nr:hypothetical protein DMA12_17620 [Amycolatopsis balhimycina DSM 5908]
MKKKADNYRSYFSVGWSRARRKGPAMTTYFVTGATGFVGKRLVARLLRRPETSAVSPPRACRPTPRASPRIWLRRRRWRSSG